MSEDGLTTARRCLWKCFEQRLNSAGAQYGGVPRFRRESSDQVLDKGSLKTAQLLLGFSSQPLGQSRTGGDRRGAALCLVARLGYDGVFEADRHSENISTSRIGHFDGDGRGRQFADAAWILEMVDQAIAVHPFQA